MQNLKIYLTCYPEINSTSYHCSLTRFPTLHSTFMTTVSLGWNLPWSYRIHKNDFKSNSMNRNVYFSQKCGLCTVWTVSDSKSNSPWENGYCYNRMQLWTMSSILSSTGNATLVLQLLSSYSFKTLLMSCPSYTYLIAHIMYTI